MADFVAVLRKTLDGLGETTPEIRQKVYAKARATVEAKLAAIDPPPPQTAADRQRKVLEDAIATVEAGYGAQEREEEDEARFLDPIEELESAIASLSVVQPSPPITIRPKPVAEGIPPDAVGEEGVSDAALDEGEAQDEELPVDRSRRKNSAGILVAVGALVLLAVAGYAAWLNKDDLAGLLGGAGPAVVATDAEQPADEQPGRQLVEDVAEATDGPDGQDSAEAADEVSEDIAAADPQPDGPDQATEDPGSESGEVQKFTQRLRPDGSEIDTGPAGDQPRVGEGTSVAASTPPPLDSAQPLAQGGSDDRPPAAESKPLVAVGQKAIFYEERTNAAQGSAENGSIVWSLVRESPGGDLPPEPAIRAEATIPAKDLQLRMTIRRNGDPSLPASHIIEMIFLTPDNFEGGGIDNVLRIALKESEQAAGNPLIGIPAKIADGFFLVALSDGKAEVDANMTMLRRQSWIDIPIVYRSGRRALFTMEKGVPGDKVFDEAIQAWQAASSG
jgi:hypothetical protein